MMDGVEDTFSDILKIAVVKIVCSVERVCIDALLYFCRVEREM